MEPRGLLRVAVAAIVSVALLALLLTVTGRGTDADVAAEVNGEPIPLSAVESRFESITQSPILGEELADDEDGALTIELQASVLTVLIREGLWEQGATELGIEVTEADVEAQRAEQIAEVGGEDAYEKMFEQYALDEDDFAAVLRDRVVRDRVREHLRAEVRDAVEGRTRPGEEAETIRGWAEEQVREASVEVDPRFGAWDADGARVDPSAVLDAAPPLEAD